jgi:hypothetical protein
MKKLPVFKNEDEEREFWATHDLVDVFDDAKGQVVTFPNLKPSFSSVATHTPPPRLRLPAMPRFGMG